jgi:hypothetical protein
LVRQQLRGQSKWTGPFLLNDASYPTSDKH